MEITVIIVGIALLLLSSFSPDKDKKSKPVKPIEKRFKPHQHNQESFLQVTYPNN